MIDLGSRIEAFVKLGTFFNDFCISAQKNENNTAHKNSLFQEFDEKISTAQHKNGWFTKENIIFSLESWATALTKENFENWTAAYMLQSNKNPKTVALIMAGNIPLVGFHDLLCVLISGNKAVIKVSSNDKVLLPFVANVLVKIEPRYQDALIFTADKLPDFDMVIATGSNNTARYFEFYFKHKPHIIRKNRNSVAILTGEESHTQLAALGEDIFRYYGLGCRSVSKLYVPKNYDFEAFFKGIYEYHPIIEQVKYANNYDYNKAVYLMSEFKLLDNGFLILKEDKGYASPIASLAYERYEDINTLKEQLQLDREKIQCIVANGVLENTISFGQTQHPSLSDYADGEDTLDFLLRNK